MVDCAIRESKEELNIDIDKNDLSVVHISHRVSPQNII
jgi:8-oxo-dGTP pyrophosphatase MutT (NUDIX family)